MLGVSGIQDVVEQVPEKMAYKAVKQEEQSGQNFSMALT